MSRTLLHRRLKYWLGKASKEETLAFGRRQAIKRMGQLALLASMPVPLSFGQQRRASKTGPCIVGSGLAGLTVAYNLAKAGIHAPIYEASARSGGRVLSRYQFVGPNLFCEEGGEFIDTDHYAIQGLAAELQILVQELKRDDLGMSQEFYFFGGRRFEEKEVIAAFRPLSQIIKRDSQALFRHGEFFVPTIYDKDQKAAQNLDRISLAEYLEGLKSHVSAWVLDLLRVAYVGQYGLELAEQSALNLLVLIEPSLEDGFAIFGDSDEALRLEGGNSRLIQALEQRLANFDVKPQFEHRLIAIKEKAKTIRLIFEHGGSTKEVETEQVVLTLPFSVLREVEGIQKLNLPKTQKHMIADLGYGSNSKYILSSKSRFWRETEHKWLPSNGSFFTEQPSQAYWETSRRQPGQQGVLTCYLGGKTGRELSRPFREQIIKDLGQVFPGCEQWLLDTDLLANWSKNPHSLGSYSCPKPGQYTSMIGACSRPNHKDRYLFAGEHCSVDYSGYMNGAISTGLQVAATLLANY